MVAGPRFDGHSAGIVGIAIMRKSRPKLLPKLCRVFQNASCIERRSLQRVTVHTIGVGPAMCHVASIAGQYMSSLWTRI